MKKLFVIEQTTRPRPTTYIFFVRASDIGKAHQEARKKFGKGISFHTREPNDIEKQIAPAHQVIEAD
jgi:hypothetical protein